LTYDLIIVSKSINKNIQAITQRCIDSARADGDLNVILVETSLSDHKYTGVNQFVNYRGAFCYNKALNLGLKYAKGDIYILANNDLIFYPGWSEIGDQMILNGFGSASALSQDPRQRTFQRGDFIYESYNIGSHLCGWCLFITKDSLNKIGKLDESMEFWYSDNVYAEQIEKAGVRHGLFCNVRVDHITSVTLKTLTFREQRRFSFMAQSKYRRLKNAG
jgi:hypothetical protein